jgi:error-prone DNA polymerase
MDLLFERFISRERNEAPDIDVDFEHERREEVLQYLYEKYGRERAGMTAVVITYRRGRRSAMSARRWGCRWTGSTRWPRTWTAIPHAGDRLEQRCRADGHRSRVGRRRRLMYLDQRELIGFPRHLSQHVGGMVITRGPLCELVPIENAAMAGPHGDRVGQGRPGRAGHPEGRLPGAGHADGDPQSAFPGPAASRAEADAGQHPGRRPAVYDMICRADTMGVFQIESRAQMSMLPRLRPRCYYDLVIEVAIVRPGPIPGPDGASLSAAAGRRGPVTYPNDEIREVLHKTLGVPIFQEQAMRLAVVAAGFTPGEADQLRRAMGAWRRPGVIDQFRRSCWTGCASGGCPRSLPSRCFSRSAASASTAFPNRTPPASRCWSTSRPG